MLVKATPDSHQELARFSAVQGKTWNTPAIADGKLIVRNQTEMVCYDLSKNMRRVGRPAVGYRF